MVRAHDASLCIENKDSPRHRIPGSAKGLFVVPDDFDAPLEDFRD
ncbi:MAG: DUF2281 domain-containing protein [Deltaproteobacteria bacterium]|nr:DUF2281 domain-containing protein [Deltaproteobacteria bacterium]